MTERVTSAAVEDGERETPPEPRATRRAVLLPTSSISYATRAAASRDLRERLEREAAELAWDWWVEGLAFQDDPAGLDRLFGDTRIFQGGYHTPDGAYRQVVYEDGVLMAWRDASRIVELLGRWSSEHGIDWELSSDGEPVGVIRHGEPDAGTRAFLESLLDAATSDRDTRIEKVLAEHAARWGEPEGGGA